MRQGTKLRTVSSENLQSILAHGIVPRADSVEKGVRPIVNDLKRLDRRLDANSLSVGHPNHRMLWKYRQTNPETDWVVLAINPAILQNGSHTYCPYNAAEKRISETNDSNLRGMSGFAGMFGDNRDSKNIWEPADDQAEILVAGTIDPSSILGVFFLSDEAMIENRGFCGNRAIFNSADSKAIFESRFQASDLSGPAEIARSFQDSVNEIGNELWNDRRLAKQIEAAIEKLSETPSRRQTTRELCEEPK